MSGKREEFIMYLATVLLLDFCCVTHLYCINSIRQRCLMVKC